MTASEETDQKPEPVIPKEVYCVVGKEIPYADFKKMYAQVYEQVSSMSHLLMGRVTFHGELGGMEYDLHTFKASEETLLTQAVPSNMSDTFNRDMAKFNLYKVVMSLVKAGGSGFPSSKVDLETSLEDWVAANKDKIEAITGFDSHLVTYLSNVYEDVVRAKQYAFFELMPNP